MFWTQVDQLRVKAASYKIKCAESWILNTVE